MGVGHGGLLLIGWLVVHPALPEFQCVPLPIYASTGGALAMRIYLLYD